MLKISKRQAWDFCFNEPVLLEKSACCVHLARTHGAFVWDWSFQVLRPPSHGRESFFAYSQLVAKAFLRRILELDPHDSVSIVIATRVLTVCILDNKVNQWHIFLFWVHGLCLCSEGYRWRLPKPFFAIFFCVTSLFRLCEIEISADNSPDLFSLLSSKEVTCFATDLSD